MNETGKLIKVMIHAYKDEDLKIKTDHEPNPIYLPVNPESFSENFKISTDSQQGQGNQGSNPSYSKTLPEELKLDFVFDGTQIIEGYQYNGDDHSVKAQLKIFKDTVYKIKGEIHRPPFLKVQWGKYMFASILTNLELNYTLFEPNGDPLRVKASATFTSYIPQEERVARERNSSPDLTHIRQVKGGDRLDLMTSRIYNKPDYVIQIAKANGLSTFRSIVPGTEIVFPPLDKQADPSR